jgi:hypothetical protein
MSEPTKNGNTTMLSRDSNWRTFAPAYLRTHRIWPNQLRYNTSTGEGELVVRQSSKWDEYALSQAGCDYLLRALQEEKISAGYVVLEDRTGKEVARKPMSEVAAELEHLPPRDDGLGLYWWMCGDLTPQDAPADGSDNVPF